VESSSYIDSGETPITGMDKSALSKHSKAKRHGDAVSKTTPDRQNKSVM